MVVHNPNNWHWVDKNCFDWAKKYFQEKLVGLSTKGSPGAGKYAKISKLSSIEGDCEVNQRKGKVISLFDLKLVILIEGNVDDDKFEGSISVPEIAFDSEASDYQFDISIYKETSKLNEIKPVIREQLVPVLREVFQQFGKDLLATNGHDIQITEDKVTSNFTKANQASSFEKVDAIGSSTKKQETTTSTSKAPVQSVTKASSTQALGTGNTTVIHLEPTFNVPAQELYITFINKNRINAWSRSSMRAPDGCQDLKLNDTFELFGGNVISKLVEQKENKLLIFEWKLNSWNAKQQSLMKIEFHESKEYHETKLQITWTGIPIGEEDRARANFEEYYVRSIKLTFGFGAVL